MSQSCHMATHQLASDSIPAIVSLSMPADPSPAADSIPDASTASTQTSAPTDSLVPGDPLHTASAKRNLVTTALLCLIMPY